MVSTVWGDQFCINPRELLFIYFSFFKKKIPNCKNKSKCKMQILRSVKISPRQSQCLENQSQQKFISLRPGVWYQIFHTISLLRHMSTSATLIAFRRKSLQIYDKNVNSYQICEKCKSLGNYLKQQKDSANIKTYLS